MIRAAGSNGTAVIIWVGGFWTKMRDRSGDGKRYGGMCVRFK
jgi:hypothetical protein